MKVLEKKDNYIELAFMEDEILEMSSDTTPDKVKIIFPQASILKIYRSVPKQPLGIDVSQ